MNRQFFKELELPAPEIDLEIGHGTANEQISRITSSLDRYLVKNKPDLVIVPGDTNSALASGIVCSKLAIKVAHLEAGCRSNDFRMSEELNRRVLDHISHILLCPTSFAYENVLSERAMAAVIENVGDTMLDSVLEFETSIKRSDVAKRLGLELNSYALMTAHRAENVDNAKDLQSILKGVGSFELPVIFPAHPRTKARLDEFKLRVPSNVILTEPLTYFDALKLIKDSSFVVTDSGGLQKEAYWLEKPSLILRETTEWMEIVRAGSAILTGCDAVRIHHGYLRICKMPNPVGLKANLFGDGHAAHKVADVVEGFLSKQFGPNDKNDRMQFSQRDSQRERQSA